MVRSTLFRFILRVVISTTLPTLLFRPLPQISRLRSTHSIPAPILTILTTPTLFLIQLSTITLRLRSLPIHTTSTITRATIQATFSLTRPLTSRRISSTHIRLRRLPSIPTRPALLLPSTQQQQRICPAKQPFCNPTRPLPLIFYQHSGINSSHYHPLCSELLSTRTRTRTRPRLSLRQKLTKVILARPATSTTSTSKARS